MTKDNKDRPTLHIKGDKAATPRVMSQTFVMPRAVSPLKMKGRKVVVVLPRYQQRKR